MDQVARYRGISVEPLGPLLDGWADQNQTRWSIWPRKQSEAGRLPEAFPALVDAVTRFADGVVIGDAIDATWDPLDRAWRRASTVAVETNPA